MFQEIQPHTPPLIWGYIEVLGRLTYIFVAFDVKSAELGAGNT
jgi:hypothetical protein